MAPKCKARNQATCPYHGVDLRKASKVISQVLLTKNKYDAYKFFELRQSAENYNPQATAKGAVVEYDDGSTEVLIGEAGDSIYSSDWTLTGDDGALIGLLYEEKGVSGTEGVELGVGRIEDKQKYYNSSAIGSRPVFDEGDGHFASPKKINKITVL